MALFSTEMVSKYHPDKYADQISDAILTHYLSLDPHSHVACECLTKDRTVVIAGEITSKAKCSKADHQAIVRKVAASLNYQVDNVIDLISAQSVQIEKAVNSCKTLGAGDQGMMFGYACSGGRYHLPFGQELATLEETIYVSGGQRGIQVQLKPEDLVKCCNATIASFT